MRFRSRSVPKTCVTLSGGREYLSTIHVLMETMSDLVGSRDTVNPCSHTRYFISPAGGSITPKGSNGDPLETFNAYPFGNAEHVTRKLFRVPDGASVTRPIFEQSALESMLKDFTQPDFNILNFILELDELLPSLLHKNVKNVGDGILNWEFGISPFISDILSLGSSLRNLSNRLKAYSNATDFYANRRFGDSRISDGVFDLDTSQTISGNSTYQITHSSKHSRACEFVVSVDFPDMSDEARRAAAFADALGFNPDAATLWNAIPFSFVVDWVFNVGGFLEDLKKRGWFQPAVIGKFRWITETNVTNWTADCIFSSRWNSLPSCGGYFTTFGRTPGDSVFRQLGQAAPGITVKAPSGKQVFLGALLARGK